MGMLMARTEQGVRIITDFSRFPTAWSIGETATEGVSVIIPIHLSVVDLIRLLPKVRRADLILLHSLSNVYFFTFLFLGIPFLRKPLVAVDLILRKPKTARRRLAVWMQRQLLRRVDHFIHYFRDLRQYEKYYGISSDRSSYVPFKANQFGNPKAAAIASEEKEKYVYAAGWSL